MNTAGNCTVGMLGLCFSKGTDGPKGDKGSRGDKGQPEKGAKGPQHAFSARIARFVSVYIYAYI